MKNAAYWIELQKVFGYGSDKTAFLLENYESVTDFFDDVDNWKYLKFLTKAVISKLHKINFRKSNSIIKYCEKSGIKIITIEDNEYPLMLKRIKNPPAVLYVRGTLPNFDDEVCISMVGTRNCSMNGMIISSTLAYRIASAGAIVISGGANGIDTKCTQGALFAGQASIIVRPCGVDNGYLNNLKDIRDSVAKNGAVISEVYPLDPIPKGAFHIRNRLMAALCLGLVVIEAPLKSGALITVSHALEMGKDVFCVPGDISSENHTGSNKLLQDGAYPVYTASDVLNEYIFAFPHKLNLDNASIPINEDDIYLRLQKKYSKPKIKRVDNKKTKKKEKVKIFTTKQKIKSELQFETDDCVKTVYKCFQNNPVDTDYLVKESGLKVADVLYAITELEINDVINSLPGGRFEIK